MTIYGLCIFSFEGIWFITELKIVFDFRWLVPCYIYVSDIPSYIYIFNYILLKNIIFSPFHIYVVGDLPYFLSTIYPHQ